MNPFYFVALGVVFLLAVSSFLPQIRALSFFNYMWPFLIAVWFVSVFISYRKIFVEVSWHRLVSYFFFFYVMALSYLSGNSVLGNRYLEFLQCMIFLWTCELVHKVGRARDLNYIIGFLMIVVVAVSVTTLIAYQSNPYISRTAKKDTGVGIQQMAEGVGGYEFVYMLVFIFIPLLYGFLRKKSKLSVSVQIVSFLLAVLIFINIYMSNFSTALVTVLAAIVMRVVFVKMTKGMIVVSIVLFFASVPILLSNMIHIVDLVLPWMGDSINAQRLTEIRVLLSSGLVESSIEARLHAFNLSVETASRYPLLGVLPMVPADRIFDFFGQHSFLLDSFALFGVLVGSVQFFVFIYPLWKISLQDKLLPASFTVSVFILTVFFMLVNNCTPSIGVALYLFLPALLPILRHK